MAAGDTLLICEPHSAELPASASADLEVYNYRPVIAFDGGSSDESIIFSAAIPIEYANVGCFVYLKFVMASATSGGVVWNVSFENTLDKDMDSDDFAMALEQIVTITDDKKEHEALIIFTNVEASHIRSHEYFRLKVTREASDTTNDTAVGDAYLMRVEIRSR